MKTLLSTLILTTTLVIGQAQISFYDGSFDEAKALAKEEGKMMFLDFYADWCVPCKQMERYGFRDPVFSKTIRDNFIAFKVDIDQFSGMDIAEHYRVDQYPTLLVTDAGGLEKSKAIGYQSGQELNEMVKSYIKETE